MAGFEKGCRIQMKSKLYGKQKLILLSFIIILGIAVASVTGCTKKQTLELGTSQDGRNPTQSPKANENEETAEEKISEQVVNEDEGILFVYVCGAVKQAGVYELSKGARMGEAVAAAGGMTEEARTDVLNLAQTVEDGQMIRVPAIGEELEEKDVEGSGTTITSDSGKININQADAAQLTTLSGIGASRAASIIRYREEHGNFNTIEDIKNVEGIKDGVFQKIKDDITVGDDSH